MMQMIIANRLSDGRVVFLNERAGWVPDIADGLLLRGKPDAVQRLARAQQAVEANVVVDPYLIDVLVEDGRRRPTQVREQIRAFGPSVGDQPHGGGV